MNCTPHAFHVNKYINNILLTLNVTSEYYLNLN